MTGSQSDCPASAGCASTRNPEAAGERTIWSRKRPRHLPDDDEIVPAIAPGATLVLLARHEAVDCDSCRRYSRTPSHSNQGT